MLPNQIISRAVFPDAYKPFGLVSEFSNLSAILRIYREGSAAVPAPTGLAVGE
jgi:hypothetical protein